MGTFTQSVAVICTTAGTPLHLEISGRSYTVAAQPKRWFQRRRWWAEEQRAARGQGLGLVDHEVWRLQARLSRAANAPLMTFDVSHHLDSGRWRLIRIHDAVLMQQESA